MKLFEKKTLATFILEWKKTILKNFTAIRYFFDSFPDERKELAEFVVENRADLLQDFWDIKHFVGLFPDKKEKFAEFVVENRARLLKDFWEIERFVGLFPDKKEIFAAFVVENRESLLKDLWEIERFIGLFPDKKEIFAEFAFDLDNLERLLNHASDIKFFRELFKEKKPDAQLANLFISRPANWERLLKCSDDIQYFMGLFEEKSFATFILRPENANRLLKTSYDARVFLDLFPYKKEELAEFIFKPDNLKKIPQNISDIDFLVELAPNRKEELAEFVFAPENLKRLLQDAAEINLLLKLFPNKKDELTEFIFHPDNMGKLIKSITDEYFVLLSSEKRAQVAAFIFYQNDENRLLKGRPDIKHFVKIFTKEISYLIKLNSQNPGDARLTSLLESIIEETFRLNDIDVSKELYYVLHCTNEKYIKIAVEAAHLSGYTNLEENFRKLLLTQLVSEADWDKAKIQKDFFGEQVFNGLKLDKDIAKQLTTTQLLNNNVEKLTILKNDIVIYLIKGNIISIENALELDQEYIQGCREVYASDRALMPLLFGEHPVDLSELILHKENANLKAPCLQRLIIKGKATIADVLSLSDEDILTIATREEDISSKISSHKRITLKQAIEESLKNPITCTIKDGETVLMVGPAKIESHNLNADCDGVILIEGNAKTGQKAHVFCRFGLDASYTFFIERKRGSINKTLDFFKKAFSQMEVDTCKVILVSNQKSNFPDELLDFLKKEGIQYSSYSPNRNAAMRRYFNICYETTSGHIEITNIIWHESLSFDSLQAQKKLTTDVGHSSSSQLFLSAPAPAKKRKIDSPNQTKGQTPATKPSFL